MPKQTSRSDALGEVEGIKHAFGVAVSLLFGPTAPFGPAVAAAMAYELSR